MKEKIDSATCTALVGEQKFTKQVLLTICLCASDCSPVELNMSLGHRSFPKPSVFRSLDQRSFCAEVI